MDLGASARARIVRELFCTFAACRTPLLHHSLRNLGDVSCALHSDFRCRLQRLSLGRVDRDRKSTRLNSSHGYISYAVFCLKKKNNLYSPRRLLRSSLSTTSCACIIS